MNEQKEKLNKGIEVRNKKIADVTQKIENAEEKVAKLDEQIELLKEERGHLKYLVRKWNSYVKNWRKMTAKAELRIEQLDDAQNEPVSPDE